ncbi:MAG TPA: efflux RND transporter periplasmic adaptor subunit [Fimbriimonadaceae bacterium]|nr:efflux RND transporter periplasmic adaptor subunit [Fimbriimonadaceae bacterium]
MILIRRAAVPASFFVGVLLGLIALVVLNVGCVAQSKSVSTPAEPVTARVEVRDLKGLEVLAATVVTPENQRADVVPPYRAPVEQVMVTVGARVRKGEVLAQLSFPDAKAAYEQARSTVQAAETAYKNAETQLSAPVQEAQRALDQIRADERRARALEKEGVVADLQAITEQRLAAEQNLEAARSSVRAQLTGYQQQLDAARTYLREAQAGAKMASIRAPISGVVLALNIQAGQEVGRSKTEILASIVDLSAIEVHATIDPERRDLFKEGAPVVITFADIPNKSFDGKVRRVVTMPSADNASAPVVHKAIVDFRNDQGLVKPGMSRASMAVRTKNVDDVLAVPVSALRRDSAKNTVVRTLVDRKWVSTKVETGVSDGEWIEVKSGLEKGELVQLSP